jgi:hypothetical protein
MSMPRAKRLIQPWQIGVLLSGAWAGSASANECADRYFERYCTELPFEEGEEWIERCRQNEANLEEPHPEVTGSYAWSNDYTEWDGPLCREVNTTWQRTEYRDYCFDGEPTGSPYSVESGTYFFGRWEDCGC